MASPAVDDGVSPDGPEGIVVKLAARGAGLWPGGPSPRWQRTGPVDDRLCTQLSRRGGAPGGTTSATGAEPVAGEGEAVAHTGSAVSPPDRRPPACGRAARRVISASSSRPDPAP